MIKAPKVVDALVNRDQAAVDNNRSYSEALAVYAELWDQARRLNPQIGVDWRLDIEADISIARALRGLPPTD